MTDLHERRLRLALSILSGRVEEVRDREDLGLLGYKKCPTINYLREAAEEIVFRHLEINSTVEPIDPPLGPSVFEEY